MKPIKLDKIKDKEKVYNTVRGLYNKRFENYYNEYNELSDVKKDKLDQKLKPINLKLKGTLIDIKNGVSKSIFHMIKHINFEDKPP